MPRGGDVLEILLQEQGSWKKNKVDAHANDLKNSNLEHFKPVNKWNYHKKSDLGHK